MESQIAETKKWLDKRYSKVVDGRYYAHQPIYGYDAQHSEPNSLLRIARTYHLLKLMDGLRFSSFLDVGGGEGYVSGLVARLFGAEAVSTDLSSEAGRRAREIFGVNAVSADGTRLPFPDRSFDLVLCSEVIEHLPRPAFAISELVRVAKKFVIVTTAEFSPLGELEREARLWLLDDDYPHAEKNWFTANDFKTLLGSRTLLFSQMDNLAGHSVEFLAATKLSRPQAEQILEYMTSTTSLDVNHDGVIALSTRDDAPDVAAIEEAYRTCQRKKEFLDLLLDPFPASKPTVEVTRPASALVGHLACVRCGDRCADDGTSVVCQSCRQAYEVVGGVPVMILDESTPPRRVHTPEGAVELLSQNNADRGPAVRSVVAKLHGPRPVCRSPFLQKCANGFLRVYWLMRRPESLGRKLSRMMAKLRRSGPADFAAIEDRIFSR